MTILTLLRQAIPHRHPLRLGWHKAKAILAAVRYGFPARHLTVIGVTGTDGKTTTVGMISHILDYSGINHGALSTAFFRIGNVTHWNTTQKTSPSPFEIQKFLRDCVSAGCTHAVLEYSSHGLVQHRTDFTWPMVAAITNISPEHLDYHGTMEQYRKDKERIFEMVRKGGTIIRESQKKHTNPQPHPFAGAEIRHQNSTRERVLLNIVGDFNQENASIAIACTEAMGIPRETAIGALKTFEGVPGRMEQIQREPFAVYVDFTVTPVAYEKTLTALREMIEPGKRILVLTGSCGDRMREKRSKIGHTCSTLADVVVVSNEDPYTEDPEKIIDDVFGGMDRTRCEAHRIPDRMQAIRFLFEHANPGDTVILCGKGSDTTMWTSNGQVPWNEREVARDLLHALSLSSCPKPQSVP